MHHDDTRDGAKVYECRPGKLDFNELNLTKDEKFHERRLLNDEGN